MNGFEVTNTEPTVKYTITSDAGFGGSITPRGTISYPAGFTQRYDIAPKSNYSIADIFIDGEIIEQRTSPYIFENLDRDRSIDVTFKTMIDPTPTISPTETPTVEPTASPTATPTEIPHR